MWFFFVYATHKKTELVWKIQPRFVFVLLWNIQFLDLNFEFLINNSRKKWKTITLRANHAVCLLFRLLLPLTDWFRHRCIYYFNILSRMNETNINMFCFLFIFYINLIQLRYFRTDLQVFNLEKPLVHCFAICFFLVYSSSSSLFIFYTFCCCFFSSVCGCKWFLLLPIINR